MRFRLLIRVIKFALLPSKQGGSVHPGAFRCITKDGEPTQTSPRLALHKAFSDREWCDKRALKDLNPRHLILETSVIPTELRTLTIYYSYKK